MDRQPKLQRSERLKRQLDMLPQLRGYKKLSPDRQQIIRLSLYLNERAERFFKIDPNEVKNIIEGVQKYGISAILWIDYNCHLAAATLASALGPQVNVINYPVDKFDPETKFPESSFKNIAPINSYEIIGDEEIFFNFLNSNIPCVVRIDTKTDREHSFVVLDEIKLKEEEGYVVWEKYGLGNYPFQLRFIPKKELIREQYLVHKIPS